MIVGFMFMGGALGESVIGIESFYALKKVYDCKLIIFTSKIMQNLLQYCDFVDLAIDLNEENINSHKCDYLLLSKSDTYLIRYALKTNAKNIVCATKPLSFISPRCKTVPIYTFKKYYMLDERQILLEYARRINRKLYDKKIKHIDLNRAKVKTSTQHKVYIHEFLQTSLQKIQKNMNKHTRQPYLIAINPFNNACPYSLTLNGFLKLIYEIAKLDYCIPCVATYPQVNEHFINQYQIFKDSMNNDILNKLIVFSNNNDLLNLAEFINQMSCVISPSTGTIHLACNLRIPTIALYPQYDTRRWATHNNRYVFIPNDKSSIQPQEENIIIENTINMIIEMIKLQEISPTHIKYD